MKHTPLKRKKGLNKISLKHYEELNAEAEVRMQLCERAGGTAHVTTVKIGFNKVKKDLRLVTCMGGYCEECHKKADYFGLHPHEKLFRSHGGKVSLENSLMLCQRCHSAKHGIKVV